MREMVTLEVGLRGGWGSPGVKGPLHSWVMALNSFGSCHRHSLACYSCREICKPPASLWDAVISTSDLA